MIPIMLDPLQLTGRSALHVVSAGHDSLPLHPEAGAAFSRMRERARADGIELAAVSAFRDFQRQSAIWNAKWTGQRPLYDLQGQPVEAARLSGAALAHAILTWSALPGASRHHWGTDLDVIDAAARPAGYEIQLLPHEFGPDGYFFRLHEWLRAHMAEFGFFFPYRAYLGGVSPEPWHISYAPIAGPSLQQLSPEMLRDALIRGDVAGTEILLELLPEIHQRYVLNISPPETPSIP